MAKYALFLAVTALLSIFSTTIAQSDLIPGDKLALPIFFFHGVTANATAGHNLEANFTAEGRLFTSLSFCPDLCSIEALNLQIPLAIAQIRSIVANDPRYDNGYVFVSHSQGGAIARGVIEEMDDHKVKVFVSMAGAVNGGFNGPQPTDTIPFLVFVNYLGPRLLPAAIFDFSKYTQADYSGKLQRDFAELAANTPALQSQYSAFNLGRSPYFDQWVKTNPYFPKINNLNICEAGDAKCEADKKRRRDNFLKLKGAHFFASSGDDVISPWQQSHLGSYSEVASAEEIETKFASLKVLDATQTREYLTDSYGLQTLDKRGGLPWSALVVAAIIASAALPNVVDARGRLALPAPTFIAQAKPNPNYLAYGVPGDKNPPRANAQNFASNWAANGFKSLKSWIMTNQQPGVYDGKPSGGTTECGYTDPNGTPQPLPDKLAWPSPTFQHPGPCEAWCDDVQVMPFTPSCKVWEASGNKMTYDKAKCEGKKLLQFFWLATHVSPFQVYVSCVSIKSGAGGARDHELHDASCDVEASYDAKACHQEHENAREEDRGRRGRLVLVVQASFSRLIVSSREEAIVVCL